MNAHGMADETKIINTMFSTYPAGGTDSITKGATLQQNVENVIRYLQSVEVAVGGIRDAGAIRGGWWNDLKTALIVKPIAVTYRTLPLYQNIVVRLTALLFAIMLLALPVIFSMMQGTIRYYDVSTLTAVATAIASISIFSVMRTLSIASRRWVQPILIILMFCIIMGALIMSVFQVEISIGLSIGGETRIQGMIVNVSILQLILSILAQAGCAIAEAE